MAKVIKKRYNSAQFCVRLMQLPPLCHCRMMCALKPKQSAVQGYKAPFRLLVDLVPCG
ncbi:hypothetical protein KJ575_02020 [Patescibacteria group bacterium]|nr:hypothetical protein [Patescibacteria group bacterium]